MATNKNKIQSPASPKKAPNQFIESLYSLIESQEYSNLINWADDDKSFTIYKPNVFAQIVLPVLCKHSNLSSFIRQLNMYCFKKCRTKSQGDCISYFHPFFVKGKPELLKSIARKNPRQILAQKKAQLQDLGTESPSSNLSCKSYQLLQGNTEKHQKSNQSTQKITKIQESRSNIIDYMNQMIEEVSSKKSDNRVMSMIRNYLNDDEDDCNELANSKIHKKLKYSSGSRFSTEGMAQYIQMDFNTLDLILFESNQSKASLNSALPRSMHVLHGKDFIKCQDLISKLFESKNTSEDPFSLESDSNQSYLQAFIPSKTESTS